MKSIIAAACVLVFVVAEPPPANSYLPPSPAGRSNNGYPRGGPNLAGSGVIAARSQNGHDHDHEHDHEHDHDHFQSPIGIARGAQGHGNQPHGHHSLAHDHKSQPHGHNSAAHSLNSQHGHNQGASARFSPDGQGYNHNASPFGRNADSSGEPASYNFEYAVSDFMEGTDFGHHEERQDDRAEGEYHVVLPDGRKQTVSYEADERGFKPHISYEDTDAVSRSNGYDSSANNLHGNQAFKNGARNHGNGY